MGVRADRVRRLRVRRAIGRAVWATCLAVAGLSYLQLEKNVTLVVDGRAHTVRSFNTNVGQLLELRGITLDTGDLVRPSPTTTLADGMVVVVDRDEDGSARGDGSDRDVGVWAVEGVDGRRPNDPAALEVALFAGTPVGQSRVSTVKVVVQGKVRDVFTNAGTVRELLSAMGIVPDGNDRVLPPPRTPLPLDRPVRYERVEYRVRELRAEIPFETLSVPSSDLEPGEVRVVQEGAAGVATRTVQVRRVDGERGRRWILSREVLRAPVPERRLVGAGEAEPSVEPSADPSPLPTGGEGGDSNSQVGEASWYYAPGDGLTAAHPSLPFGTRVTVTNLGNGRTVTVVINDRGPFGGRIIDLSQRAFSLIAPLGQGVAQVRLAW